MFVPSQAKVSDQRTKQMQPGELPTISARKEFQWKKLSSVAIVMVFTAVFAISEDVLVPKPTEGSPITEREEAVSFATYSSQAVVVAYASPLQVSRSLRQAESSELKNQRANAKDEDGGSSVSEDKEIRKVGQQSEKKGHRNDEEQSEQKEIKKADEQSEKKEHMTVEEQLEKKQTKKVEEQSKKKENTEVEEHSGKKKNTQADSEKIQHEQSQGGKKNRSKAIAEDRYDTNCTMDTSSGIRLPNATKAIELLQSFWMIVVAGLLIGCLVWFFEIWKWDCLDCQETKNWQEAAGQAFVEDEEPEASAAARFVVLFIGVTLTATPLVWEFLHPQSVMKDMTEVQYMVHNPAFIQVLCGPLTFVFVKLMLLEEKTVWKEIRGAVPQSERPCIFGVVAQLMACFSFFAGLLVVVLGFLEVETPHSDPVGFIEQSFVQVLESSKPLCIVIDNRSEKYYLFTDGHDHKSGLPGICSAFEDPQVANAIAGLFLGMKSLVLYVVGILIFTLGEVMKLRPEQQCYLKRIIPNTFAMLMRQNNALAQLVEFKKFQRCAVLAKFSSDRLEDFQESKFDADDLDSKEMAKCIRRSEKFTCAWSGLLQSLAAVLITPFFRLQSTTCFGFDKGVDTTILAGHYDIGNVEQFFHMVRYASFVIVGLLAALSFATVAIQNLPGKLQVLLHDCLKFPIGADLTDAGANAMAICIIIFLVIFGADFPLQQSNQTEQQSNQPEKGELLGISFNWRKLLTSQCFLVSSVVVQFIVHLLCATMLCNDYISPWDVQQAKDQLQTLLKNVADDLGNSDADFGAKACANNVYLNYADQNPGYQSWPPRNRVPLSRARKWLKRWYGGCSESELNRHLEEKERVMYGQLMGVYDEILDPDLVNEILEELALHSTNAFSIYLQDKGFGDSGANILTKFPKLKELYLNNSGITDAGVIEIAHGMPSLTRVNLQFTQVGVRSAQALAEQCPYLEQEQVLMTGTKFDFWERHRFVNDEYQRKHGRRPFC